MGVFAAVGVGVGVGLDAAVGVDVSRAAVELVVAVKVATIVGATGDAVGVTDGFCPPQPAMATVIRSKARCLANKC